MIRPVDHVLVICDGSRASDRALVEAACIADEHEARISVVALAAHEDRTIGCCGIGPCAWNRIQDELAQADLDAARLSLAERDPQPTFVVIPGTGPSGVRRAVALLQCDLVLVPARGLMRQRFARQVRRRVTAGVIGVQTG